jgi:hypothetical protein
LRRRILRSSSPFATCSCEHSASWRSVPKRCVPAKRNPFPPARRYGGRLLPPGQQPEYSARRSRPGPVPAHRKDTRGSASTGFS